MEGIIARLMGLDELPPQQPLLSKKRRVLSDNYLHKTASLEFAINHLKKKNFKFDPKANMAPPSSTIIVLKPSSRKSRKTKNQSLSLRPGVGSDPVDLKYKEITRHKIVACDSFLKADVLKLSSSNLFRKRREYDALSSFSKRPYSSEEAQKQIIGRWKLTNNVQQVEIARRSQSLGEVLSMADLKTMPQILESVGDKPRSCSLIRVKTGSSSSCSSLGIRNKDAMSVGQQSWTDFFQRSSISTKRNRNDLESPQNLNDQTSPNSVLEPLYKEEKLCASELRDTRASLCIGVVKKLHFLETDFEETYSEGSEMGVSSDEEFEREHLNPLQDSGAILRDFKKEEGRDFFYMVDVLDEASSHLEMGFVDPSVFDLLEKKYGKQEAWIKSERKLLFDRISIGLSEILHSFSNIYTMNNSLKRKCRSMLRRNDVEEELWKMLFSQENKVRNDLSIGNELKWLYVEEEVGSIHREIENFLYDELVAELACV